MSYWTGRAAIGSTGNQTMTMGSFTPTWARFRVTGTAGKVQQCEGATDGTRQNCNTVYTDGSGSQSWNVNTRCVSIYDRVSGSLSEVLGASFVSFGFSGGVGTITLNFSTASPSYFIAIECGD